MKDLNTPKATTSKSAKNRATEDSESESDSESEYEIAEPDMVTKVRAKGYIPEASNRMITIFENEIKEYYGDHTGPFRRMLARKDQTIKETKAEISDMLRSHKSRKLLVAVTGYEALPDTKRTIKMVLNELRIPNPTEIDYIPLSAWFIVTTKKREDLAALLKQKAVYDPMKRVLVVFRAIQRKPGLARVFEIKGVNYSEDLDDIREYLIDEKAEVRININVKSNTKQN